MNVAGLQRIDYGIGIPLCLLLTLVRAITRPSLPDCSRPPKSLLVVKLAEQGSTVLAYPALCRAVDIVGRNNVYFVVFEENRFILDALGVVPETNVITISTRSFAALVITTIAAVQRLRALKLDSAVDLEFFSRGSAVLTALSGASRRVGYHAFCGGGPNRGNLMTHRLVYNPQLHTSRAFLALIEAVMLDPVKLPAMDFVPHADWAELPQLLPSALEAAEIERKLSREPGTFGPIILLNPNAGDLLPLRRWPAERYEELAKRLLVEFSNALIVFTGAPSEEGATLELTRRINSTRCISLGGKTTLRQLLVLYTLADILVTNDSGPAHFAALTSISVVSLFGPETPALFGSLSPRNHSLWAGIACSPCVSAYNNRQSPCRDNVCMQSIRVDQVFAIVCATYSQSIKNRSRQ